MFYPIKIIEKIKRGKSTQNFESRDSKIFRTLKELFICQKRVLRLFRAGKALKSFFTVQIKYLKFYN